MNPIIQEAPELVKSLQLAYSAEKAAAFAYIGHTASLKTEAERAPIREIEKDEWAHRREVKQIMDRYEIPVNRFLELKYHLIGRLIGFSCHVIGRFMPYFFAGRLESGNVCEYIVMLRHFRELGITEHDATLYEMGIKEKAHEVYFQEEIAEARWLPYFEKIFNWGAKESFNDLDYEAPLPLKDAGKYCDGYKRGTTVKKDDGRK
ncbi:MAG: hypothetical protein AAF065_13600 [Verrucomicrobiota bacterium]